jgi:hypothetical protein
MTARAPWFEDEESEGTTSEAETEA